MMKTLSMIRVCPTCQATMKRKNEEEWRVHQDGDRVYGPFCGQECCDWDSGASEVRPPMYWESA